ncbi:MAG: sodium:proline symporter, partial [Myxococcota bacterium]
GAAFGPVILLTLYWKRLNGPGVIASMVTGAVVTIVWSEIEALESALSARASAFLLALLVAVGVSLFSSEIKERETR